MLLRRKNSEGPLVPISSRVTRRLKARLQERADKSGIKLGTAIAELLQVALDFEDELAPFRPAIERLMREENLSVAKAVAKLLWMDVELNPRRG
jgi:hypothetical protein